MAVLSFRFYGGDDDQYNFLFDLTAEDYQTLVSEVSIYNQHIDEHQLGNRYYEFTLETLNMDKEEMEEWIDTYVETDMSILEEIIEGTYRDLYDEHDNPVLPPTIGFHLLPMTQTLIRRG